MLIASLFMLVMHISFYLWPVLLPITLLLLVFGGRYWLASYSLFVKILLGAFLLVCLAFFLTSFFIAYESVTDYFYYFFDFKIFKYDVMFFFYDHAYLSYILLPLGAASLSFAYYRQAFSSTKTVSFIVLSLILLLLGSYSTYLNFHILSYLSLMLIPLGLFSLFSAYRYWKITASDPALVASIPLLLLASNFIFFGIYNIYLH